MTDIDQEKIQAEIAKIAEDFRDSMDIRFNPQLRTYLANIVSGCNESRDFKTSPLSENELQAIAQINTIDDYYVEQMQDFIAHIHEDKQVDTSNLMNKVMQNVRYGSLFDNEKSKKSFQYFQEFIENI